MLPAHGKIKQHNEIIDGVSEITKEIQYKNLCYLLRQKEPISNDDLTYYYRNRLGDNWRNEFWFYVNSKTSQNIPNEHDRATYNIYKCCDISQFIPRLEKEHGVTLTSVNGKVSNTQYYVVTIL